MKNILISKKLFIGFLLISNYILKAQFDPYDNLIMQKKTIMGTWVNSGYNDDEVGDSRWTMKFTAEGKCFDSYAYDNGKKDIDVYSYKIEKGTTESGLTVYSLDLYGISDSNEHYSYEVYAYKNLGEDFYRMALHYLGTKEFPTIKNYTFKKISEPPYSKPPSKEKGLILAHPQTASQAYQAGYDDCKNGNSWGTSLWNKQYEMDYDYGWGKAGCPVR